MTLDELDAQIAALGRPMLDRFTDALRPSTMAELRIRQATWDVTEPEKRAERTRLLEEARLLTEAEEARKRRDADAAADLERMRRLVGAHIADKLSAPREEPALVAARKWLEGNAWALTLVGSKGNGKTFSAAWCVKTSDLRPVVWLHSPTACARPLYGPAAQFDMQRAQQAPLFVLDEFGAELVSAPYMTWLEAVLGVRYAREMRTIITSNLSVVEFKKRLGERLADRLFEGVQFETSGASLRKRTA